jgi:hypothetical protein
MSDSELDRCPDCKRALKIDACDACYGNQIDDSGATCSDCNGNGSIQFCPRCKKTFAWSE